MALAALTLPNRANQIGWTRIMELQDGLLLLKPELKRKSKAFNDVAVEATATMRQIWSAAQHADIRTDFLKEVTATRGTTLMAKLVRYLLRLTKEEIGSDVDLQRKQTQMAYALDYMETYWKTDRDPTKGEIIAWINDPAQGGLGLIQMKWLDHLKRLDAEQADRDRQAEEEHLAFQEYQARQRLERDAIALDISPEELVQRREREAESNARAAIEDKLATVIRQLVANGTHVTGEPTETYDDNAIYHYRDGKFIKLNFVADAIYTFASGKLIMVRDLDRLDLLACKAGVLTEGSVN